MNCLRLDDFAAAQAGGADADAFGGGAYAGVHRAQIHVPAPLSDVMGVADAVSELRLLAADITLLCHDCRRSFQRPYGNLYSTGFRGLGTILVMHFAIYRPDWNSLDSVRRAHSDLEAAALVFFALLVVCEALAHLSDDKTMERRFDKIGIVFFAMAVLAEIVAYPYGQRNDTLSAQTIVSLDAKSREASTNASTALTKSEDAETKADEAETKSGDALTRAHTAEHSLAKAENDAGKAQTAAANALTTAMDASVRAGKAETSLGNAEAEAKGAETSSSNALTLAREVRQEAASFESDLARLRQQAADRELDEYQQEQVRERIAPFLGTPYELAVNDTPEAQHLLVEIDKALSSAGWIYRGSDDHTTFRTVFNLPDGHQAESLHGRPVQIGFTDALSRFKPAVTALVGALNAAGITTFPVTLPHNDTSPNNIHIMVGAKP